MNVRRPNIITFHALIIIWDKMQNEYVEKFGFSESFLEIFRKEKEIAKLIAKKINTGDQSVQTFINIATFEAEEMRKKNLSSNDIYETKTNLERIMGFKINLFETSAAEFFGYIKSAEKLNITANGRGDN